MDSETRKNWERVAEALQKQAKTTAGITNVRKPSWPARPAELSPPPPCGTRARPL